MKAAKQNWVRAVWCHLYSVREKCKLIHSDSKQISGFLGMEVRREDGLPRGGRKLGDKENIYYLDCADANISKTDWRHEICSTCFIFIDLNYVKKKKKVKERPPLPHLYCESYHLYEASCLRVPNAFCHSLPYNGATAFTSIIEIIT